MISLKSPGRKDDLESLIYILFFLQTGSLPVLDHIRKRLVTEPSLNIQKEVEIFRNTNRDFHHSELNRKLPPYLLKALNYVRYLGHKDKPDYTFLRLLFATGPDEELQIMNSAKSNR